ncbi:MAG TPA: metallophosphoesterase [Leptolyngbyaceae cyanobacterium M65_K2018_010]|nr:metallophosphoesterase [Leptolyngbyaceae cyanobacterium M65_K2018_010]
MGLKLTIEPAIATKISKMQQRVRWQHPALRNQGIDQTRLLIEDGRASDPDFSFLVLGDSGTGRHRRDSPQRQVAEQLLAHGQGARFILHTGDVVYLVGSREQYPSNFIKPYREWLVSGEEYSQIAYDRMVFQLPFLPVPGNHDYYDLPLMLGVISGLTGPLRYVLRSYLDLDVGWHGSFSGDAYARAFLDYLRAIPEAQLPAHLEQHYTSRLDGRRCLSYRPAIFTRLPNRYYRFRYGGIDFFALDSNTFNQPLPLEDSEQGRQSRQHLQQQRQRLEVMKADLIRRASLNTFQPLSEEDFDDLTAELEEIDEQISDLNKQLAAAPGSAPPVDSDQLDWLRDELVLSWQTTAVRGRILFFHHPPYVTEATKWSQGQTLAVRDRLRQVLDQVAAEVGSPARGRPLVNLVLNGHAHCLEYLRTGDTGHGDAHMAWVICGGSGYSLRRQRPEGADLQETLEGSDRTVAQSQLYLGRSGKGSSLKRPYSGLRIDVHGGSDLTLTVTPLVAEKFAGSWHGYRLEPFAV